MKGRETFMGALLLIVGVSCGSSAPGVDSTARLATTATISTTATTTTAAAAEASTSAATVAAETTALPATTVPAPIDTTPPSLDSLRNVAVPSACGFLPGQLIDGSLPIPADSEFPQGWVELTNFYAAGDLDDDGLPEIAVVFSCGGGGVSWPDELHVLKRDLTPVGYVDLSSTFRDIAVWRGSVDSLTYDAGLMRASASLEESGAEDVAVRQFTIGMANGKLVVTDVTVPCPQYGETAQRGSGVPTPCESIAGLQRILDSMGHPAADDGQFGPGTEAAVKAFQADVGLPVTGIIDASTWYALLPPD